MEGEVRVDTGRRWYSLERKDFRLSCDASCEDLRDISRQHKCVPFIPYIIYRLVFALYFVITLVYFVVAYADFIGAKFFIYLTDWTYIVAAFYQCLAVVNALLDQKKRRRNDDVEERFRYQLHWLCLNICATVSIIVTVVYWAIIRPLMEDKLSIFLDVSIHLLPCVVCLVDVTITPVVIRFAHVVYPLAYCSIYLIFAVIYWAAGGTDILGNPFIYPILDFGNEPGIAAASIAGICLVTLLAQAALKGLCLLRVRCLGRHERRSNERSSRNHTGHHVLQSELDTMDHIDTDKQN